MRRLGGADAIRIAPVGWSSLLAVLMLGGALGPGFVLAYDMVWVPDLAMRSDFLGLGSSLPRAVPSDAVVAVLDEVVPGMLLQKAVLVLTLVAAGVGAWRLIPETGWVAQGAASTLYVWNPFVAERLGIGHWPLLMTYAALPWIHVAARRWATGQQGVAALVLWMAFGSLSPVGGLITAIFAVLSVAVSRQGAVRRVLVTGGSAAALNAPWIVAGALHGSNALSDPLGVSAFAAQGEGQLPTFLTLLGLGGIWNAEVVPVSRTEWPAVVALVLVVVLSAAGAARWRMRTTRPDRVVLLVAAAVGLLLALAGALLPDLVGWLVAHVPGMGLLRDGARFIALLAPLEVTLFGLGVARVAAAVPSRSLSVLVATGLILSPVSLLPDAALGLSGRLGAVSFPDEFAEAERALGARQEAGRSGDLLVLPFIPFRLPQWNDQRRTLDPVGRYFPVNYLASDTLVVSGRSIPGEDSRARRVGELLRTRKGAELEEALRREGVSWVVVDREAEQAIAESSPAPEVDLGGATVIHSGPLLTVWELGDDGVEPSVTGWASKSWPALVLLGLAWAAAMGVLCAAVVHGALRRSRSAKMRREP